MAHKVFWDNPYLAEFETRVASVDGNQITLEETIFYALSGGQESDAGSIGGYSVLNARKDGKQIYYTIQDQHQLVPGSKARVEIDWNRRYQLMRLHFAAEVVLEIVTRTLPAIEKVGAHIAPHKARIDFIWDENISKYLPQISQEANSIILADHKIISAFSDLENERRFWEVEGFARVPCGGTHLKRTGEVGQIELKRVNKAKGKERIEIFVRP